MKKKILCLIRGESRERFIEPLDKSKFEVIISSDWDTTVIDHALPQLVLSIGESSYEIFNCFKRAKQLNIPTLTIQDGIPEWRDMFSNPKYTYGDRLPNRQFLIADKVTCFGINHVNLFNAFGMYGQTELVGYPLFDELIKAYIKNIQRDRKNKILIMTANTPYFNSSERLFVEQSLIGIDNWLKKQNYWKPIWRVRKIDLKSLGIESPTQIEAPLHQIIHEAGAVISTPSTVVLESMLFRIPVVILDYTNSPLFIDSAWKITSSNHIENTLTEIINPSSQKMKYQDIILNQWLYISEKETSSDRLNYLVEEMTSYFEMGLEYNTSLVKSKILNTGTCLTTEKSELHGVEDLFPRHSVFSNNDLIKLQLEAANLKEENLMLRQALIKRKLKNLLILYRTLKKTRLN